jgi:membrane glycosyltransferase
MDRTDPARLSRRPWRRFTHHAAPPLQRGSMPARPWGQPWTGAEQPDAGAPSGRRRLLVLLVLGAASVAAAALLRMQPLGAEPDATRLLQVLLFALLFGWVAAGFATALMGFVVLLRGDRQMLSYADVARQPLGAEAGTAVIMPICNEQVDTVFAGLRATAESLIDAGGARLTELYVLSDTSDPALREAEFSAWQRLRQHLAPHGLQLHYRWRARRTHRKAGNVADFCRRWGRRHRYMVVLDADSVMSGDAILGLMRLMEAHPQAGIVQSAPVSCGLDTLHARAQQFATRVTGRLFAAGMQFWQLGESHYWGHNAIIRIAPFMAHCGLAPLPGRGGLSGSILSHDFVEAALMRRAGWQVWLVPDLPGSWEQQPPHLLAELQRDRRWCQGNLHERAPDHRARPAPRAPGDAGHRRDGLRLRTAVAGLRGPGPAALAGRPPPAAGPGRTGGAAVGADRLDAAAAARARCAHRVAGRPPAAVRRQPGAGRQRAGRGPVVRDVGTRADGGAHPVRRCRDQRPEAGLALAATRGRSPALA